MSMSQQYMTVTAQGQGHASHSHIFIAHRSSHIGHIKNEYIKLYSFSVSGFTSSASLKEVTGDEKMSYESPKSHIGVSRKYTNMQMYALCRVTTGDPAHVCHHFRINP
jgi:hypothetical protein